MNLTEGLQHISTAIAILGSALALWSRYPDRRRQRFREQHQTLAALFPPRSEPQHDLVVESAFRAAFAASPPAPVIRYLLENRFSLTAVEQYCDVREYISWDERSSVFSFRRRRHRIVWGRWIITTIWFVAYVSLAYLAFSTLQLRAVNSFGRIALYCILVLLALACLRQSSLLFWAGKFVRDQRSYATPRASRIAARHGVVVDSVSGDSVAPRPPA